MSAKNEERMPGFGKTARAVLETRYLLRNNERRIVETPDQMFLRVARRIAKEDLRFGAAPKDVRKLGAEFYMAMHNLDFLPNSPTLMNAGTEMGQLSACFVLPIEDSMESIFETLKNMALIHQSGGGVGYSFSNIRPKGALVRSSKGSASGPVSFLSIFDTATDVIKQGGRRRGANIAILRCDHPDILEFIAAKEQGELANFNISVAITDRFMSAVAKNRKIWLSHPRAKSKQVHARAVFDAIMGSAWKSGDPGVIFIDEINRRSTLRSGLIEATNPCGEQPLYPYESCNLGSINLANMTQGMTVDWDKLSKTVYLAVRFLDNAIEANRFPLPIIETTTKRNRKIGLGVMGFADMLIRMRIRYDSDEAVTLGERLMDFITDQARCASAELGKTRGSFPGFRESIFTKEYRYMRNATVTTIAPTGTLSIIADTSSGIEPIFALGFRREILGGKTFVEMNRQFVQIAKEEGIYSRKLMAQVARAGSIQRMKYIKSSIRQVLRTSMDIAPEWHVRMQAAFQKHTDNAVSKTVNLPQNATLADVKKVFTLAHESLCKGITVYRYASKERQVLNVCAGCKDSEDEK